MNAIVVVDQKWAIGREGGLLFSLPTDMKLSLIHILAAAAKIRETRVGMATPSTPRWNTKIKSPLPTTLMAFMAVDTHMEVPELPITRNSAAPAL